MSNTSSDQSGSFAILHLPPILDLRAAAPLVAEFGGLRGRPLTIDASAVEKIGAQCVQVLVSAQQTWARDGVTLTLSKPSEAFNGALALLGVPTRKIGE
ncbi:MAG TPA: STAS domain-containing protein [Methylocystis sp.]|jgi:chemotaxis protein CheX